MGPNQGESPAPGSEPSSQKMEETSIPLRGARVSLHLQELSGISPAFRGLERARDDEEKSLKITDLLTSPLQPEQQRAVSC